MAPSPGRIVASGAGHRKRTASEGQAAVVRRKPIGRRARTRTKSHKLISVDKFNIFAAVQHYVGDRDRRNGVPVAAFHYAQVPVNIGLKRKEYLPFREPIEKPPANKAR
jgi:hypothetical protein